MQTINEFFLDFYMKAFNKERIIISEGKWLKLEKLVYSDQDRIERNWETATRLRTYGAVAIIAILKPSNKIILIRQYRPPAEGYVIEFPAGLIDEGETPECTAVRELREETGYKGTLDTMLPPSFSSPGLSGEQVYLAFMSIDEKDEANINPLPELDEGEHVETLIVGLPGLAAFLDKQYKNGDLMDTKVLSFAHARQQQRDNA